MNEKIYQAIKRRIVFMKYEPGQVLDEKAFAEEFRVSRSIIGEALRILEISGIT